MNLTGDCGLDPITSPAHSNRVYMLLTVVEDISILQVDTVWMGEQVSAGARASASARSGMRKKKRVRRLKP